MKKRDLTKLALLGICSSMFASVNADEASSDFQMEIDSQTVAAAHNCGANSCNRAKKSNNNGNDNGNGKKNGNDNGMHYDNGNDNSDDMEAGCGNESGMDQSNKHNQPNPSENRWGR